MTDENGEVKAVVSHGLKRSARAFGAIGLLTVSLLTMSSVPAGADPAPLPAPAPAPAPAPTTANDAIQQILNLSRESEQMTAQMQLAQQNLDAKVAAQHEAEAKIGQVRKQVDAAKAQVASFQPTADMVARVNYEGDRLNRLYALLISDSPQQLLDQMSALDQITQDTQQQLDKYHQALAKASAAQGKVQQAVDAARAAAQQADAQRTTLAQKQSALQAQINQIRGIYASLTGSERSALAGTLFPPGFNPAKIPAGGGPGFAALQVALTRIGDPYVWGATGPNQFDCSGLVQWAFKQIGIGVPRTSQQQAQYGTPVPLDQLQPGDIITFYQDASHVGIYVGNGMILHASTFGVPVKVQSMAGFPIHNARRF